ncbi:Minor fimbrium subunit Mfa1 [bioreactor metagenome]|uniref:Minor fimbrium subunit Mfa1 n=1 Tax=bioreactor metagenome TaxID=1076179 RepID=A0A645GH02_9ZZZZ
MKYVLWLNPNSTVATVAEPNPMVSPTVRNQVYHAHIDAFLRMGVPNNPLDPNDPNDSDNPDNPIDPKDPLKTDITYLSVSVKVLPWTIHTYKYSLTDGDIMY